MKKQFSCKTAADHYSYSQAYFRKLIYKKIVPHHKLGKSVRFYADDLDAYFKAKMRK